MDYLKEYNISEEQIKDIEELLLKRDLSLNTFLYDSEKITSILDLFTEIGVTNLYDIIMTSPSMFYDTVKSIKLRIDNYGDKKELASLLNEDAANLFLADLM